MPEKFFLTNDENRDIGLIIALVPAIGTDVDQVVYDLRQSLARVNFKCEQIHVSNFIKCLCMKAGRFSASTEQSVTRSLMDGGDALRQDTESGGAAGALAISGLTAKRRAVVERGRVKEGDLSRVAWIIRSVKHPSEIRLLRSVYGPRLFVIGVWSARADRERKLEQDLRGRHPDWRNSDKFGEKYAAEARHLLKRDENDKGNEFGQKVNLAFPKADAFVALRPGVSAGRQLDRIVRLLFKSPFETPSRDETGMLHAFGAKLRSSAPGRQVGVAITDTDGELLVTGVNEVAKAGGGQYWDGDDPDFRDFIFGYDPNDQQKLEVVYDLLNRLSREKWLKDEYSTKDLISLATDAINGPLGGSRVNDIIEFIRASHAEMAAIATAARRTIDIRGSVLYTTTFPCHECARLIVAAGISKVVYIDPYPKSRVEEMYSQQITLNGHQSHGASVIFAPFEGVAPSMMGKLFETERMREHITGRYEKWESQMATPRLIPPDESSAIPREKRAIEELAERLQRCDWLRDPGLDRDEAETKQPSQLIDLLTEIIREPVAEDS